MVVPAPVIEVVPPPVELTIVVTVVVVPSGSILLAVRSVEVVGDVSSSSIPVSVSLPWLGGSLIGSTVTNSVSFTQALGVGVPASQMV